MPTGSELPEDQQKFFDQYLIDRRKVHAYMRAFPGTSYSVAAASATRMFKRVKFQKELKAVRAAESKAFRVSASKVTKEIARVAFADILDIERPDGTFRRLSEIPIDLRRAISAVKVRRQRTKSLGDGGESVEEVVDILEYKLASKLEALDKLSKRLGLDQEITPLESLLALLPAELREQVSASLAAAVSGRRTPTGDAGDDD